jgi:5-(carboxyamino)imidazole ribonucleotide mutase
VRVASAHKVPLNVLKIIEKSEEEDAIFITVAGRSNALSGLVDASTTKPVIACPPYSEKFASADIFSSLRAPSGVAPLVVLEPEEAALAAAKILALKDERIREKIMAFQKQMKEKIERDGESLQANEVSIREEARIIREGGLVAFPTETVYELGADATNPEAVARIFEVKRRPKFDPIIVHIARPEEVKKLCRYVSKKAKRLMEIFWPGPLTLVSKRKRVSQILLQQGLSQLL